jgi:hypothetical protein
MMRVTTRTEARRNTLKSLVERIPIFKLGLASCVTVKKRSAEYLVNSEDPGKQLWHELCQKNYLA